MSELTKVTVKSTKPDGYRRAGFAFNTGENELAVTIEQYKQIEGDKNLHIEAIDLDATAPKKKIADKKVTK